MRGSRRAAAAGAPPGPCARPPRHRARYRYRRVPRTEPANPTPPRDLAGAGPAQYPPRRSSSKQKPREFLSIPQLLLSRVTLFLVEAVSFLGQSLVQELVVGVLGAVGDHVLQPTLEATFQHLLQPLLLFLLRILCGIRDLMDPLLDVLAGLCQQLAVLLRAVRLVEVNLRLDRGTDAGDRGTDAGDRGTDAGDVG